VFPDKEGVPVHFWPGPAGGKEWTHAAYSPNTQLLYCPVQDVGATATRRQKFAKCENSIRTQFWSCCSESRTCRRSICRPV